MNNKEALWICAGGPAGGLSLAMLTIWLKSPEKLTSENVLLSVGATVVIILTFLAFAWLGRDLAGRFWER